MATEKWIAGSGQGLTWGSAMSASTFNSLTSGNAILSDVDIDNTSALDMFADVSIALGSATFASPNFIGIYLYPLNQDGTTYGDGRFGTSAAGQPSGQYYSGAIPLVVGTQTQVGIIRGVVLVPGHQKFVLYNGGGVNLASSGNALSYRTYNRSIA